MSNAPDGPRPRWYRPSVADCVFLLMAIAVIQHCADGMLDDPGLGWHLRNVDAMIEQQGWLTVDPFSGPRSGERWFTNQWLGDFVLWAGDRWGGLEGIAVVTTLVIACTLRLLYRMLIADGLPWPEAAVWTYLAALGTSMSWVARPNVFTLPFVLITARVCDQVHRGRCSKRTALWLIPMFTVWANTHGGFVAGLVILAAASVIEAALAVLESAADARAAAWYRCRFFVLLAAAAFVATLVNPYGLRLYAWVFQLLGDSYFMNLNTEWLSPDFHGEGALKFELLMLLLPTILGLSTRRPSLLALGLSVLWLHFAFGGRRYIPLWIVVTVPMLARAGLDVPWRKQWLQRINCSEELRTFLRPRPGHEPFVWSLLVAVSLMGWARYTDGVAGHNPEYIPAKGLDYLLEHFADQRVFHGPNWGGYLTWHGWPQFKNWTDDRNEVQGQAHLKQYFSILRTEPGWEARLDELQIDVVCIGPVSILAYRLGERADWNEDYRDDHVAIFVRQ